MTAVLPLLLFLTSATNSPTLAQVRADANPEHRAKAAIDFAVQAERAAETAVSDDDSARLQAGIANMVAAMELARDSFIAAGKLPWKQPGTFKNAELRSHDILHRLADLRDKMDSDQRAMLDGPIMKIQEIHDAWFDGIMGKKK